MNAITQALEKVGGQCAMARAIGVTQGAVWQWVVRGSVPADRVLAIYRATSGQVTPHQLRPDIYPDPDYRPNLQTEQPHAA